MGIKLGLAGLGSSIGLTGLGVAGVGSGSLGLGATGDHGQDHSQSQQQCEKLFHLAFPPLILFTHALYFMTGTSALHHTEVTSV